MKKIRQIITIILILCLIILEAIGSSNITYAKEKTGEQMVADVIKTLNLEEYSYWQKIVICSAWIGDNITYDHAGLKAENNSKGRAGRTIKDTMTKKVGVCEGYARTYKEFMDQIGVPCLYITDEKMNHAYNYVMMNNNKWYLVEPQAISGDNIVLYEDSINGLEEDINELEKEINSREEEFNYDPPTSYLEKRLNEMKYDLNLLKETNNKGVAYYSSVLPFLAGLKDYGERYYQFVNLKDKKLYGYYVADYGIGQKDPNPDQKTFNNLTKLKAPDKLTINAAKCNNTYSMSSIKLKNYSFKDLDIDYKNLTGIDVNGKKLKVNNDILSMGSISGILDLSRDDKGFTHISRPNITEEVDSIASLTFDANFSTIFGNKDTTKITIKYPKVTKNVRKKAENMKIGERIKVEFTDGLKFNDFKVELYATGANNGNVISYNKGTGTFTAVGKGIVSYRFESKSNKYYTAYLDIKVK